MTTENTNDAPAMKASPAVMTMTLEITRAATGKTETVEIVCTPVAEQKTDQPKE